jgi:HrpA-like RNA helicase
MQLIEEGRRGILVFRPGVGEVKETAEAIEELAKKADRDVEITQIYGDMGYAERKSAVATTKPGVVKVLVGTNVVESGANIPWLDAGVSCGTGKENSVRPGTGATYLELVDLPRWRLSQQEGRVKRFCPGVFVLCAQKSFELREQATRPEIERLALTELVMHCATLGLRAHELTFDYTPNPDKVVEAEVKLQRLGLIDADCMLTEAGKEISGLPIGPETGAMLWHAHQLGCLEAALPLAAVVEVGGLRKESRYSHFLNSSSDHLDAMLAFRKAYLAHGKERREVNEGHNISFKRFEAASELLHDLERRLDIDASFDFNHLESELRQVILAGSLEKLYRSGGYRGGVSSIKDHFASYSIGNGSVVSQYGSTLVIGDLRVITPKDKFKSPFTVLEKVTSVSLVDLKKVAKHRPEILVERREPNVGWGGRSSGDYVNLLLFGEHLVDQMLVHETIHIEREVEPESSPIPSSVSEMPTGSLGDILGAVLQARR